MFEGKTPEEMMCTFIETCEGAVATFAPKRSNKKKFSKSKIPRHRRVLMRKRTAYRSKLHKANNETRKTSLKTKLIQIERSLQDSYQSQAVYDESKAVEAIRENPKYFYSYAKKRQKLKSEIGPLMNSKGIPTNKPQEMAELLSEQFLKAFSSPMSLPLDLSTTPQPNINDLHFTPAMIIEAINEVRNNSAPGPDRFPAILLKNCRDELAYPLYLIWRASLDTGIIPKISKSSIITPIFKSGDKQKPSNYRPVALTSHLIKVFEKVLRTAIVNHIEANNLLNPNQHGFRSGRSCLSQLVHHYDQVTEHMENGKNIDIVYLDFSKAFDKLDFKVTLQKLQNIGITGKIHRWIESFLTGREQTVTVNGAKSKHQGVQSGVPQGSVIGPILFLILLGDIDGEVSHASVSSFADDTRILGAISRTEDTDALQSDLDLIYGWSTRNNTQFNADKFECLRYGTNEAIKRNTVYYSNHGTAIEAKETVKDLGVTLSCTADFSDHIANIKLTASLKCGWVLRTFHTRSPIPMLTLWKSMVLPHLDYCCQLWNPWKAGDIQKLENVQASFIKKIHGMSHLNYWEQLTALNLYSLQRRRERYIAIYTWKTIESLVPNFGIQTSVNARTGRHCQVPSIKASAPARIKNVRFNSLTINGPRIFNSLPQNIRDISGCSTDAFKRALDQYLRTIPDEPRVKNMVPYCAKSSNSITVMRPV